MRTLSSCPYGPQNVQKLLIFLETNVNDCFESLISFQMCSGPEVRGWERILPPTVCSDLCFHHNSRCCEGLLEDHTLKKVYIHLFMNHISRTVNQWREVLKNSNQSTFTLEHREENKLQICQKEGGEECNSCSGPKYHSKSRKKERVKVATFNLRSNLKRKDLFPSNLDFFF